MEYPKLLISGNYNAFKDGWNSAGIYMVSGLYQSQTFKQPIYIGGAVNIQRRVEKDHIPDLNANKHYNLPLQNSWNKYGEENFVWYLLETCTTDNTYEIEQKYLDLYRPFADEFNGFNIAKNSLSCHKGRKLSEKHRLNLSNARKEHPSCMKGKSHSLETRQKISFARKHGKPNNIKRVKCLETGKVYNSLLSAAKEVGLKNGDTISLVCQGRAKTAGGYTWEYINKQETKP